MAQPMRSPPYPWMISARPATLPEAAPVSTLTSPLVVPSALDVYAMLVQGSEVTEPV